MSVHDAADVTVEGALESPGCPVCTIGRRAADRFLAGLVGEFTNDAGLREVLRTGGGLCAEHAWRVASIAEPALPLAIIWRDVIQTQLERIASGEAPARGRCPACSTREDSEGALLRALISPTAGVITRLPASDPLCIPHLREVMIRGGDSRVIGHTAGRYQELLEELTEFKSKFDYRRAGEAFGRAADAWLRATALVAGPAARPGR